jgi:hypothetical protein
MYLLKKEELKELIEKTGEVCISIYLPVHDKGQQIRQDPIRLKNIINKAEEQLKVENIDELQINEILKPATDLIDNIEFWNGGYEGLAIFLTNGFSKILKLPEKFNEILLVNKHFHLKQLLPFFSDDKRFHILAISQNKVRFLDCTKYNCREVQVEHMPESMEDALFYISKEQSQDIPFKGTGRRSKGSPTIESGGNGGNDGEIEKERVFQYFREIDKALKHYLHRDTAPLVIATVESQFPIYKNANNYKNLLDEYIKGNPERLSNEELHKKALGIVEPYFHKSTEEAINKYIKLYGTDNVVHNIRDALTSAYEGRIDTLLVAEDRQKWGRFDPNTTEVEEHKKPKPGDDELIDLAAIHTIKNDGRVHVIENEKMPKNMDIAGILRF